MITNEKPSTEKSTSLKKNVIHGIILGGVGNFVQQIFAILVGIKLAHLLNSADYGMTSLLLIFSQISSSLQESGFTSAIANKKEVTHKDYNAVFWCGIFISITLYGILYFAAPFIADFYKIPELTSLARVVFLGFLIGSTGIAHAAYLFKNLKVKNRVIAMTLAVLLSGIIAIIMAHMRYGYWSLAVQSIAYIAIYTAILWYYSDFRPSFNIDLSPIRELYKFSSKVFLSNIFQIINTNVYAVFVGKFYTKDSLGYLSQAGRWSTMAQTFIVSMNTNFAQPLLAGIDEKDRHARIFEKLVSFTAFISFPLMFGLGIVAQEFILLTIKEKWMNSIPFLQIAAFAGAFFPLIHIAQTYVLSKGRSDIYMKNIIITGLIQLVLLGALYTYGLTMIAYILAFSQLLSFVIWQLTISKMQELNILKSVANIAIYFSVAAITAAIAYSIGNSFGNLYLKGLTKLTILATLYVGILYFCKPDIIMEIWPLIQRKFRKKQIND